MFPDRTKMKPIRRCPIQAKLEWGCSLISKPRPFQRQIMKYLPLILLVLIPHAQAQLSFDTDAVSPQRFIAAHGEQAVAMGYAAQGLEFWAYPLQIISGYKLTFRSQ